MFEKVNPGHPDKMADRIAGAIVDKAYMIVHDPKIAVEVLLGHGTCSIIIESNIRYNLLDGYKDKEGNYIHRGFIPNTVARITGMDDIEVHINCVPQDEYLADNQSGCIRCGDNGIFRGAAVTPEQEHLTRIAGLLYKEIPHDGKYLIDSNTKRLIICQSNAGKDTIRSIIGNNIAGYDPIINPLGDWTGGMDVDSGATNRKLGSDMGDGATGGGLHGKDLSKADVSINIFAWLVVNEPRYILNRGAFPKKQTENTCEFSCAIGDSTVDRYSYGFITDVARDYINDIGGFEKLAEWGLIRPAVD